MLIRKMAGLIVLVQKSSSEITAQIQIQSSKVTPYDTQCPQVMLNVCSTSSML